MAKFTTKQTIGILGGMGPQASARMYSMIIEKSIQTYRCRENNDFPEVLIDSVPVPDFISSRVHLEEAKAMLLDRTERLNAYGVSAIGVACNTAHILLPELRRVSKAPVLSIMEEMNRVVQTNGFRRVGLLATMTTYKTGLFTLIATNKVKLFTPSIYVQQELETIIRGVIGGEKYETLEERLASIVNHFVYTNALDTIMLGCTELPLVFPRVVGIQVLSSLNVLADSLLKHYFHEYGKN